jgi:hypothetical protein
MTLQDEINGVKQMAARVIFRALCDYIHYRKWSNGRRPKNKIDRRQKETFEEAKSWLYGYPIAPSTDPVDIEDGFVSQLEARRLLDDMDQTMSFETACDILGWSPSWIRERIPAISAEDLRRVGKKHGFL